MCDRYRILSTTESSPLTDTLHSTQLPPGPLSPQQSTSAPRKIHSHNPWPDDVLRCGGTPCAPLPLPSVSVRCLLVPEGSGTQEYMHPMQLYSLHPRAESWCCARRCPPGRMASLHARYARPCSPARTGGLGGGGPVLRGLAVRCGRLSGAGLRCHLRISRHGTVRG